MTAAHDRYRATDAMTTYEHKYELRQPAWSNGEILEKAEPVGDVVRRIKRFAKLRFLAEILWQYPDTVNQREECAVANRVAMQIANESDGAIGYDWLAEYLFSEIDAWWKKHA